MDNKLCWLCVRTRREVARAGSQSPTSIRSCRSSHARHNLVMPTHAWPNSPAVLPRSLQVGSLGTPHLSSSSKEPPAAPAGAPAPAPAPPLAGGGGDRGPAPGGAVVSVRTRCAACEGPVDRGQEVTTAVNARAPPVLVSLRRPAASARPHAALRIWGIKYTTTQEHQGKRMAYGAPSQRAEEGGEPCSARGPCCS